MEIAEEILRAICAILRKYLTRGGFCDLERWANGSGSVRFRRGGECKGDIPDNETGENWVVPNSRLRPRLGKSEVNVL